MVRIFEVHSLVQSLLNTSFFCPFLDPHLTTYHLNIGVHNIVVSELVMSTVSLQSKLSRQFFLKTSKIPNTDMLQSKAKWAGWVHWQWALQRPHRSPPHPTHHRKRSFKIIHGILIHTFMVNRSWVFEILVKLQGHASSCNTHWVI